MVITLSSKGQLVIPKMIRESLQLDSGAEFEVEVNDQQQIVLTPVKSEEEILAILAELRSMFADTDLLTALEEDRKWEREHDEARIRSFGS